MHSRFWPTEFSLENIRCFRGLETGQVRPITLLVGENSTGKTTFLACYSLLHHMFHGDPFPYRIDNFDFNEEPFSLGSFKDIVRSEYQEDKKIEKFCLRLGYDQQESARKVANICFGEVSGQPVVVSVKLEIEDSFLEFVPLTNESFTVNIDGEIKKIERRIEVMLLVLYDFGLDPESSENSKANSPWSEKLDEFRKRWFETDIHGDRVFRPPFALAPLAPLRASPQRTYDPTKVVLSPEGDHVPMLLMRLTRAETDRWNSLREQLVAFGKESGLFQDIHVKNLGQDMSEPFQLQVQVRSNSLANLMDVGYGVNQCLPILVDVLCSEHTKFILQQPEVHLHPRAQAELATFLLKSVRESHNRFMIETHSDYIIDRVRIGVREKLLKPDDVSILYFKPNDDSVAIHNMWLDEDGNLHDAPDDYREFFDHETDRFLGFKN